MGPDSGEERILTPFEIIFSCSVCHQTLQDVYKDLSISETDGDSTTRAGQGVVRIWLTECGHITCSDHLRDEGLSLPLYDGRPSAPCPICQSESENADLKRLFPLYRGAKDNHPEGVPTSWFQTPPGALSNMHAPADLQAVAFQWAQLARYSIAVTKDLHEARRNERRQQVISAMKPMHERPERSGATNEDSQRLVQENLRLRTMLHSLIDSDQSFATAGNQECLQARITSNVKEGATQPTTSLNQPTHDVQETAPSLLHRESFAARKRHFAAVSAGEDRRSARPSKRQSRNSTAMPPPPQVAVPDPVQIFENGDWHDAAELEAQRVTHPTFMPAQRDTQSLTQLRAGLTLSNLVHRHSGPPQGAFPTPQRQQVSVPIASPFFSNVQLRPTSRLAPRGLGVAAGRKTSYSQTPRMQPALAAATSTLSVRQPDRMHQYGTSNDPFVAAQYSAARQHTNVSTPLRSSALTTGLYNEPRALRGTLGRMSEGLYGQRGAQVPMTPRGRSSAVPRLPTNMTSYGGLEILAPTPAARHLAAPNEGRAVSRSSRVPAHHHNSWMSLPTPTSLHSSVGMAASHTNPSHLRLNPNPGFRNPTAPRGNLASAMGFTSGPRRARR